MILLIIFIVFTMFLLYAWACIIVCVNQYCSTLTSVFNMYFSYLIHYLSIATSLRCSAQLRTVSSSSPIWLMLMYQTSTPMDLAPLGNVDGIPSPHLSDERFSE